MVRWRDFGTEKSGRCGTGTVLGKDTGTDLPRGSRDVPNGGDLMSRSEIIPNESLRTRLGS